MAMLWLVAIVHDLLPSVASATLSPIHRSSLRFPNNLRGRTGKRPARSICRWGQFAAPFHCEPPASAFVSQPCPGRRRTYAPGHAYGLGCSCLFFPVVPIATTAPSLALALDDHAAALLVKDKLA